MSKNRQNGQASHDRQIKRHTDQSRYTANKTCFRI